MKKSGKRPVIRIDELLVERGLANNTEHALKLLMAGLVWSGEIRIEKPGTQVESSVPLRIETGKEYVSRGGGKLAAALSEFGIRVKDRVCLDIGSSTGGFTDCLLKNEARFVFAVDVGKGILDFGLRKDPRVGVLEEKNARHLVLNELQTLNSQAGIISLGVADVSFISLTKIIPHLSSEIPTLREWVLLFKPQFELKPEHIRKGGKAQLGKAVDESIASLSAALQEKGFALRGKPIPSPLPGKKSGNVEYLLHYAKPD